MTSRSGDGDGAVWCSYGRDSVMVFGPETSPFEQAYYYLVANQHKEKENKTPSCCSPPHHQPPTMSIPTEWTNNTTGSCLSFPRLAKQSFGAQKKFDALVVVYDELLSRVPAPASSSGTGPQCTLLDYVLASIPPQPPQSMGSAGSGERGRHNAAEDEWGGMYRRRLLLSTFGGEEHKTREEKTRLEDLMLDAGCGRDTLVVAVGGGVVGDMVGFLAATFQRGVPMVHIVTTLMAMVDAGVGGKTAVNTPHGKNLIGAFSQPSLVVMDLSLLHSLPPQEVRSAFAEIVKYDCIEEATTGTATEGANAMTPFPHPTVVEYLSRRSDDESNPSAGKGSLSPSLLRREVSLLLFPIVCRCVAAKLAVVSLDEKEGSIRERLNFGHTIGHAIEGLVAGQLIAQTTKGEKTVNHEGDRWCHGHCVAVGMVVELEIALELGLCSYSDLWALKKTLIDLGLPVSVPSTLALSALVEVMLRDKKNRLGNVHILLLRGIGHPPVKSAPVPLAVVERVLSRSRCFEYRDCSSPLLPSPPLPGDADVIASVPASSKKKSNTTTYRYLRAEGSKSIANRMLPLAALYFDELSSLSSSSSTSTSLSRSVKIENVLAAEDSELMVAALQQLFPALTFQREYNSEQGTTAIQLSRRGATDDVLTSPGRNHDGRVVVVVGGTGKKEAARELSLFVGNSGTTARFLLSVIAAMVPPQHTGTATGGAGQCTNYTHVLLHGSPRMHQRPVKELVDALLQFGSNGDGKTSTTRTEHNKDSNDDSKDEQPISYTASEGCFPLRIRIGFLLDRLRHCRDGKTSSAAGGGPIDFEVDGSVSSQFVTSLCLVLPYLNSRTAAAAAAESSTTTTTAAPSTTHSQPTVGLRIRTEAVSPQYIAMTLSTMRQMGFTVVAVDENLKYKGRFSVVGAGANSNSSSRQLPPAGPTATTTSYAVEPDATNSAALGLMHYLHVIASSSVGEASSSAASRETTKGKREKEEEEEGAVLVLQGVGQGSVQKDSMFWVHFASMIGLQAEGGKEPRQEREEGKPSRAEEQDETEGNPCVFLRGWAPKRSVDTCSSSSHHRGLRPVEEFDCSEYTDCFMTAAIILALANGTSSIVGIANQRVKECDRIEAICTELGRLGVLAVPRKEGDGLRITGTPFPVFLQAVRRCAHAIDGEGRPVLSIKCYDDHRMAMAFGALGFVLSRYGGIRLVLEDWRCVEKTFPSFFRLLVKAYPEYSYHGGYQTTAPSSSSSQQQYQQQQQQQQQTTTGTIERPLMSPVVPCHRVIVLLGMRHSGKSSLLKALTAAGGTNARVIRGNPPPLTLPGELPPLGVDLDTVMQAQVEVQRLDPPTLGSLVQHEGWEALRSLEYRVMAKVFSWATDKTYSSLSPFAYHPPTLDDAVNTVRLPPTLCPAGVPLPRLVVIAMGGGFVDALPSRLLLEAFQKKNNGRGSGFGSGGGGLTAAVEVVHIVKEERELIQEAQSGGPRPAFAVPFEEVLRRRKPVFEQLATRSLAVPPRSLRRAVAALHSDSAADPDGWELVASTAARVLHRPRQPKSTAKHSITTGRSSRSMMMMKMLGEGMIKGSTNTYFLSLTTDAVSLEELRVQLEGVDAVEIRADLCAAGVLSPGLVDTETVRAWSQRSLPPLLGKLMRLSREECGASPLKIILTVRTDREGGKLHLGSKTAATPTRSHKEQEATAVHRYWKLLADILVGAELGVGAAFFIDFLDVEAWTLRTEEEEEEECTAMTYTCSTGRSRSVAIDSLKQYGIEMILSQHSTPLTGEEQERKNYEEFLEFYRKNCLSEGTDVDVGTGGSDDDLRLDGLTVIPKYVFHARFHSDVHLAAERRSELAALSPESSAIVVCTGKAGSLSRLENVTLTPVTHETLTTVAAPGQLSLTAIHRWSHELGGMSAKERIIPTISHQQQQQQQRQPEYRSTAAAAVDQLTTLPLFFFVAGSTIAQSRSPLLHDYVHHQRLGLPVESYRYGRFQTSDPMELREYIVNGVGLSFGGASITMPLKETVLQPFLSSSFGRKAGGATASGTDSTCSMTSSRSANPSPSNSLLHYASPDCVAIGAVNTIVPVLAAVLPLETEGTTQGEGTGTGKRCTTAAVAKLTQLYFGYNTDWMGLRDVLCHQLSSTSTGSSGHSRNRALTVCIVGAGGTAKAALYATIHSLRTIIVGGGGNGRGMATVAVFNRTLERATELVCSFKDHPEFKEQEENPSAAGVPVGSITLTAHSFGAHNQLSAVGGEPSLAEYEPPREADIIVNTTPSDADVDGLSKLLQWRRPSGDDVDHDEGCTSNRLFVDFAYIDVNKEGSAVERALRQEPSCSSSSSPPLSYRTVTGAELLLRQGVYQQRLWMASRRMPLLTVPSSSCSTLGMMSECSSTSIQDQDQEGEHDDTAGGATVLSTIGKHLLRSLPALFVTNDLRRAVFPLPPLLPEHQ